MASGDIALETTGEGSEVYDFYKKSAGAGSEWTARLTSEDSNDFRINLEMGGDRVSGNYPNLQLGKKYKITISEV